MWGTADYLGGSMSRRAPALAVSVWSQAVGLVAAWIIVAASGATIAGASVPWALAAGLVGALALWVFYAALASGAMTIVAPLSACGAVIPVAIALAGGESPGVLGAAGMAAALLGAVLASIGAESGHPTRLSPRSLGLAIAAAVGIGAFVALMQQAIDDPGTDAIAAVAVLRVAGVSVLVVALVLTRTPGALPRNAWGAVVVMGLFDAGANTTFVAATDAGDDGIVAVLGSLYPVVTVALAAILLRERPHRVQVAGVVVALIGVALIAAR